ncbi:MAG: hypothetical protein AB1516_06650 [Pseudomonadota bacterium]
MKTLVSIIALGTTLAFSQLAQAGDDYRRGQGPSIDINIQLPPAYAALGFDGYNDRRVWDDDDDDDDDWDDRDDDDDDDDDD